MTAFRATKRAFLRAKDHSTPELRALLDQWEQVRWYQAPLKLRESTEGSNLLKVLVPYTHEMNGVMYISRQAIEQEVAAYHEERRLEILNNVGENI